MQTDFRDSHSRHWEDAETLYEQGRLANADHLYGIAVECGLKALLYAFDLMQFDPEQDRPSSSQDRKHADGIWQRYNHYSQGLPSVGYGLPDTNPFSNWRIDQRYWPRNHFTAVKVNSHRQGALTVKDLMRQARLEGWL